MPRFELQSPDGRRFEVDAPDIAAAISAIGGAPEAKAPDPILEAVKRRGTPSSGPSIAQQVAGAVVAPIRNLSASGIAKSIWEGIQPYGEAVAGRSAVPAPGLRREDFTDIPGEGQPIDPYAEKAVRAGGAVITGQAPGGMLGAPQGGLGMGFARPGQPRGTPTPTPSAAVEAPVSQQVIEAGQRINVPIPRYMVDDNRMTQGLAAGLQNIPGAGDKIAKAAETTQKALGSASDVVREGFGTGSQAVAGSYAKDALADWITTGSGKVASRVYDAVDNLIQRPERLTGLDATKEVAQQIIARRGNAKIPGSSPTVNLLADAMSAPGGMNYKGIKDLRSYLGELTHDEIVSSGLKASEVKQFYRALTEDLKRSALGSGGPVALAAFNKANRIFEQIASRREALSKVIGTKGDAAPEAVFARILAMAGSKTTADISRLTQARKAMGPEAWNEVASAVVARLGRDAQGEFSITRFLGPNGYGGLSEGGKAALFRSTGKDDLGRALNDIAFVTKQIEEKLKQFYNPSGTGKSIASTGTVLGVLHSPIKTLSTILGGNKLATVLSEPAAAQSTANWLRAYHAALVAPHIGSSERYRRAAEELAGFIVRQSGGNPSMIAAQLTGQAALNASAQAPLSNP